MRYWTAVICLVITLNSFGQQTETSSLSDTTASIVQTVENIPSKSLEYIDKKYSKLTNDVQKQSEKALKRMQDKEAKLQEKLQRIDSLKAKELFETSKAKYDALQRKLQAPPTAKLEEYIPGIDSVNTTVKFLSQPEAFKRLNNIQLDQLSSATGSVQELEGRLQQANEIQSFIRERETQLKNALVDTGLEKELLSLNKEVYYYQQRLREYKALLNDKKKLEEKLLATVRDLPLFQRFMQKHSYLAQLFRMPSPDEPSELIPGLQTRGTVQSLITQRIGSSAGSINAQQYLQQQTQSGLPQINTIKEKINSFGGNGNSDMTMPDFKPQSSKTKSFFKRLEYGINFQSQQGTNFLPATTDIALHVGFKVADNKIIGLGSGYKFGWGSGWEHIALSSQGLSLRSYADIKAKGSFWFSAGFEYNYLSAFKSLQEVHSNINAWQRSALAGLTKKYRTGKRREGKVQVLYDFLASRQVPQAKPLVFRLGYSL